MKYIDYLITKFPYDDVLFTYIAPKRVYQIRKIGSNQTVELTKLQVRSMAFMDGIIIENEDYIKQ